MLCKLLFLDNGIRFNQVQQLKYNNGLWPCCLLGEKVKRKTSLVKFMTIPEARNVILIMKKNGIIGILKKHKSHMLLHLNLHAGKILLGRLCK